MAQPLHEHLDALTARIRGADHVLLFCDFDGTLTPFKRNPADCFLEPSVADALAALAALKRFSVGIVSGRPLSDLRPRVGLPALAYAGNHGLEIRAPGFSFRLPQAVEMAGELDRIVLELQSSLAELPGTWVEHKELTASVHFRQAWEDSEPGAAARIGELAARAVGAAPFVLREGDMVLDIRPDVDWHKGSAIDWLSERLTPPGAQPLVIYLGDDRTDEDAFACIQSGVTIRIGDPRPTLARYTLAAPRQVRDFLQWVLEMA